MDEKNIGDIPALQGLLKQAQGMIALKKVLPIAAPLLKLLRVDVEKMSDALEQAEELTKKIEELSQLPDRFNHFFAERGWVIYEMLNLEVAKEAVRVAETGDIDKAEQVLVEYFTPKTVRFWLATMNAIHAFRPRMRLAYLALKDYEEERYHACIPVVLALLDGVVNELNEGRGFFASETQLLAWDSISAHKKGLVTLGGIFNKGRNKTRAEQITIPYRNGIIHGTDLGYDNPIVAAKVWAALFAVRDWAIKAEKGELTAPQPQKQPTLLETLQRIGENEKDKKLIEQWQPRAIVIGNDFPAKGSQDEYLEGTPERALIEFLGYWQKKNYGFMVRYVPRLGNASANAMPKEVRDIYGDKEFVDFAITEIADQAAAVTEIQTTLTYLQNNQEVVKEYRFRMLFQDETGKVAVRGKPGHAWHILNWQFY